jgi:hypothetical protein
MSTTSGVEDCSLAGGAAPAGQQLERPLAEEPLEPLGGRLDVLQVLLDELPVDDVRLSPGLDRRDAVLQPGDAREPARPPVAEPLAPGGLHLRLHRERDVHVDRGAHLHPLEGGRRHPDDGHWMVVDPDRPTDDARVAPEAAPPEAVSQHDHRVRGGRAVVLGREEAAQGRAQAEDLPKSVHAKPPVCALAGAPTRRGMSQMRARAAGEAFRRRLSDLPARDL